MGLGTELGGPLPGVEVRNPCFERVPADLIGRIVTWRGVLDAARLRALSQERRALEDDLPAG